MFMTDGQQSYAPDQVDIKDAVQPLKDAGVYRYAIGIGREIASNELFAIASDNVVYAENFDQLKLKINDQIKIIAKRGCRGNWSALFLLRIYSFIYCQVENILLPEIITWADKAPRVTTMGQIRLLM